MNRAVADEGGSQVAEFALVVPIFLLLILGSIQLVLVGVARYEVKHIVRETTRWLAVHPDTTDATVGTMVNDQLMPGMATAGVITLTTTPACASLSGGRCPGRASGTTLRVSMVYDAARLYFLPTSYVGFSMGSTRMSSQVSMLVE